MIATLRGTLIYSDNASIIVECGGVGLKALATTSTLNRLPQKGEEVFVHTYMAVREDAIELFAFSDVDELDTFKMLISVSGVGAKMGIALLSELSASQIVLAISTGDSKTLTRANGVGPKLAQRIVLELKDKVGSLGGEEVELNTPVKNTKTLTAAGEAVEALISLGYTKGEASLAVSRLDEGLSSEELIKQALKALARRF